uniref:Uncharacterized protein n=1 Tax=Rhizophora mucronata TaxID=61149 RepID=A0A2P2QUT0_RHIMU
MSINNCAKILMSDINTHTEVL